MGISFSLFFWFEVTNTTKEYTHSIKAKFQKVQCKVSLYSLKVIHNFYKGVDMVSNIITYNVPRTSKSNIVNISPSVKMGS